MEKVSNLLIGTDIECFVHDKANDEIVSAEGLVKGTKHEPFNFDPKSKYFATSLDNVFTEFCIPPSKVLKDFVDGVYHSLDYIKSSLPSNLDVVHIASAMLNDKYLQTDNAKLFGCEPDFCVWTKSVNDRPQVDPHLRSAGFHVHFGYDNPSWPTTEEIVMAMDLHLGVPSVLIDPDTNRRKLYGKAGCFRVKEYGGEYRTLSGFFLSQKELIEWVFKNTQFAINFVNENKQIDDGLATAIQQAINDNDKKAAETIVNQYKIQMP